MDASSTSDARLDFLVSPENKRLIEEAATLSGQSVADFAVSNLVEVAHQRITGSAMTRLSDRDRDTFLSLLDSDDGPNEQLQVAAKKFKERRA